MSDNDKLNEYVELGLSDSFLTAILDEADKRYSNKLQKQPFVFGAAVAVGYYAKEIADSVILKSRLESEKRKHKLFYDTSNATMARVFNELDACKQTMNADEKSRANLILELNRAKKFLGMLEEQKVIDKGWRKAIE